MKQKLLLLFIIMLTYSFNSHAQFALGDIAFAAYGADNTVANGGPVDAFTIVLLRGVTPGEQITFTDNGWFVATGGFRTTETECTLTFGANLPEGTQVIVSGVPFEARDEDGNVAGTMTGSPLALAGGGDSVIAYNTGSSPTLADQSGLIAAINMTGEWSVAAAGSSTSTELPSIMTDGLNAVSIEPEVDNARIAGQNCTNFTDIPSLRLMLNNPNNWESNNTLAYDQSDPFCKFTDVLSVEEVQNIENAITIRPNPVDNYFSIGTTNSITVDKVEIYSITGQKVLAIKDYSANAQVDISGLGSGIYLSKIYSGDKTVVKKLIKK